MDFEIIFYKDAQGNNPIEEFFLELAKDNKVLLSQARKGIEKLRNRSYHREPLSKHIEPGLWELRVKAGTDIFRIVYTFAKGRIIILLHGFIKKTRKTPLGELNVARKRLKELKTRGVL